MVAGGEGEEGEEEEEEEEVGAVEELEVLEVQGPVEVAAVLWEPRPPPEPRGAAPTRPPGPGGG